MRFRKLKIFLFIFIGALIFGAGFGVGMVKTAAAATNLNGRILLQVQDKGQAWYVNPLNGQRYYLGRPDDAFSIMRSLGLGISNADAAIFKSAGAPRRLTGRILLQVHDKGQAYYVDPFDLKLYYLGRPADAFALMKSKGLGITNFDLARILVAASSPTQTSSGNTANSVTFNAPASSEQNLAARFTFKFHNNTYEIIQNLSAALYEAYKNSSKSYTYAGTIEPANLREAFYGLFLKTKSTDTSLDELTANIKAIAANNNWTDDQLAEFTMAFIQYIPYDHAKLAASNNRNTNPYYPYETLYLDRGVCSDKTFLAVALLRKLGYGAAILDFPDLNHTAVGISCPIEYSINGSGYCYVETTNYFPLGVIPQSISSGQAQTAENSFTNLFNSTSLGKMEIYQSTAGKIYYGSATAHVKAAFLTATKDDLNERQADINNQETNIRSQEGNLSSLKIRMDNYYNNGQTAEYNNLVPTYNNLVNQYNAALSVYRSKVTDYNALAADFNAAVKEFYQK